MLNFTVIITHLKETRTVFQRQFILVFSAWFGYYGVLHGVIGDLAVAQGHSERLINLMEMLDPIIFWGSVAISLVSLITTSIVSAWPSMIGLVVMVLAFIAQWIPGWGYGAIPAVYALSISMISAIVFSTANLKRVH